MRRGSSQARILIESDDQVRKEGSNHVGCRVRDQGIWLRKYDESVCLPAVNKIYANGYLMEKLDQSELSFDYADTMTLCQSITNTLQNQLWHYEFTNTIRTIVQYNRDDSYFDELTSYHKRYVAGLVRDVDMKVLQRTLRRWELTIDWQRLRVGLTHGDPIIDNVMYRPPLGFSKRSPELVLIDPIPACPAIPDVIASDVGRVIQSATGYEAIRYGTADDYANYLTLSQTHESINFVLNDFMYDEFGLNDARAAVYFSIIHTLRGIRTAQRCAETRVGHLKTLVYNLALEAELWMR